MYTCYLGNKDNNPFVIITELVLKEDIVIFQKWSHTAHGITLDPHSTQQGIKVLAIHGQSQLLCCG